MKVKPEKKNRWALSIVGVFTNDKIKFPYLVGEDTNKGKLADTNKGKPQGKGLPSGMSGRISILIYHLHFYPNTSGCQIKV